MLMKIAISTAYNLLNDIVLTIDGFTFSFWNVFMFVCVIPIVSFLLWRMFE